MTDRSSGDCRALVPFSSAKDSPAKRKRSEDSYRGEKHSQKIFALRKEHLDKLNPPSTGGPPSISKRTHANSSADSGTQAFHSFFDAASEDCNRSVRSEYTSFSEASVRNQPGTAEEDPPPRTRTGMGVLLTVGSIAAALYSFTYYVPIDHFRNDLHTMRTSLKDQMFCQDGAVSKLLGHVEWYQNSGHKGPVILSLVGPMGVGKTHLLNIVRKINPSWPMLVASHQQGLYNLMSTEELIAYTKSRMFANNLNLISYDDIVGYGQSEVFLKSKFFPVLEALKQEKNVIFVLITLNHDDIPADLKSAYAHEVITFDAMDEECVKKCARAQLREWGHIATDHDLEDALQGVSFQRSLSLTRYAEDGCKSVSSSLAKYLEVWRTDRKG